MGRVTDGIRRDAPATERAVDALITRAQEMQRFALPQIARAEGGLIAQLDSQLHILNQKAKLFTGFPIPIWPPHKLIRKIVRRLAYPFFQPQIVFNLATRESLYTLRQSAAEQETTLREATRQIEELKSQIEELQARLARSEKFEKLGRAEGGAPRP